MKSDGERVLVGNNEDYNIPHTRMWFFPASNGRHGRIYFGYDNFRPQGGMNDQGLFFDAMLTEKMKIRNSKEKPMFEGDFFDSFLAKNETVSDVLELFKQYNLEFMSEYQLFFADATGDSAIIEGDHIIRKKGAFQVVTNFLQSRVKKKSYPCEWYKGGCIRYQTAERMLKDGGEVSIEYFRRILETTHQNTLGARTLYSNIYDLTNKRVYIYYLHDFGTDVVINLEEELLKGAHYYEIPSLFGDDVTYEKKEYIHKSPKFRLSYPRHFNIVEGKSDEVFRIKNSFGGVPIMSVSIKDKPPDISLNELGTRFYLPELKKSGSEPKMTSNANTIINGGVQANVIQFDCLAPNRWPLKLSLLSTYHHNKLIYVAVQSWAFPDALREYLYSLRFD
jgi:hypothetical protein